jgi:hypothetical protein
MADEFDLPPGMEDEAAPSETGERVCRAEGCDTPLPTSGPGWHFTQYCPVHAPPKRDKKKKDAKPSGVQVNVQVGPKAAGKSAELDQVKERAEWLLNMIALLTDMVGMSEDAADIRKGGAQWAESVKQLAAHEAWLRKLAQGGETSERALAWLMFITSTLTLLLPILLRHKVLPEQLAGVMATAMAEAPEPQAA